MSLSSTRDQAILRATRDTDGALQLARGVADPWYRAQALAYVAFYAPEARFDALFHEALAAAAAAEEPYRAVGASAWAVRASFERGRTAAAEREVQRILGVAAGIANPVSRADALFLLFQAVLPFNVQVRERVLADLVAASKSSRSWKGQWILRSASLMLAEYDPTAASALVSGMPDGKYRRQAERRLQSGTFEQPLLFFWRGAA